MKYILGMLTFDRGELGHSNLIFNTFASLEKSGFEEQVKDSYFIVFDGGSKDISFLNPFLGFVEVVSTGGRVRQVFAGMGLIAYGLSHYEADFFIFMEDDILFCKNWFVNLDLWLKKYQHPDIWCYSFYVPQTKAPHTDKPIKAWKYPTESFYGSQCLAMRYEQLKNFISQSSDNRASFIDLELKRWLQQNKQQYILATCPSIVQHQGTDSTLKTPVHRAFNFWGEDVDPRVYE